ncbi:MAG: enoyl-CoA hydratase/isomerase family protein, partial [Pseudomonadota bacterium]|nr:enoyl-CoA hydratase/isomerase family protein [Pseudomonadota bacterium]
MSALLFEKSGAVVTLTINRPEARNPLGEEGDGERFAEAACRINEDREVRCVILTGAGKAFSAGGNLKAMRARSGGFAGGGAAIRERYRGGIHRMVRAVWGIEVPVIAAVNGPAIGLGNDMACLADLRLAAGSAIFGATFLKIGLIPGDGGAWILPRT